MTIVASNNYTISKVSDGSPGSPGPTGAPGQIYQQATEPISPILNMLWQYTGTAVITASGTTIEPNNIYVWTGTTWKLWEITVANLNVDNLSAISSKLGDVDAGSLTNDIYVGSQNGGNDVLDTGTVVLDKYGITLNWQHLINSILDSSQQNSFGTEGLSLAKFDTSGHVTKSISINANSGIDVGDINGNSSTLTPTGITVNGKDLSNTYSTSEIAVGTWTDGKIIYQKTFTFSGTVTGQTYPHGISNFNELIRSFGVVKTTTSSRFRPIPYNYGGTYWIAYTVDSTGILFEGTDFSNWTTQKVTIYYTKTV